MRYGEAARWPRLEAHGSWGPAVLAVGLYLGIATALLATPTDDGGLAIDGRDMARVMPPQGARVASYSNTGYRLIRTDDEIRIEVDAKPLRSHAVFVPPTSFADGPVGRLARGLTSGARTEYDAISRILAWMARNIEYTLDRSESQSAEAVLERRSGYCTGVARLAVALLEASSLPAREVAGYVVGGTSGDTRGFHRWIEVYLRDRGWIFSDPLNTHHYVPANYVRLDSDLLLPDQGLEGLLLERQDEIQAIDLYPMGVPGIRARRNSASQVAGAMQIHVEGQSTGLAMLIGGSLERRHALIGGVATFLGLDPGSYKLRLLLPGRGMIEQPVNLPDRSPRALYLSIPSHGPAPADFSHGDTK